MKTLEKIRTELLNAHKDICGAVEIGIDEGKSFDYNGVGFYIDAVYYNCFSNGNNLAVWNFCTGTTRIDISGDIAEALELAKIMKQGKKIAEFIKSKNL